MSGVNSPPPSTTLTIEALLELMNFVKRADYEDKLRDLVAAKVAHDDSAVLAEKTIATAIKAQKKLDADKTDHAKAVAEWQAIVVAARDEAIRAARQLADREASLKAREETHADKVASETASIASSKSSLDALAARLNKQNADLTALKEQLDTRIADLNRRLAKMREAAL